MRGALLWIALAVCLTCCSVNGGARSSPGYPLPVAVSCRHGNPQARGAWVLLRLQGGGGSADVGDEESSGEEAAVRMMSGFSEDDPVEERGGGQAEVAAGSISKRVLLRRRRNQIRRRNLTERKQEERDAKEQEARTAQLRPGVSIKVHYVVKGGEKSQEPVDCKVMKVKEDQGEVKVELPSGRKQSVPLAWVAEVPAAEPAAATEPAAAAAEARAGKVPAGVDPEKFAAIGKRRRVKAAERKKRRHLRSKGERDKAGALQKEEEALAAVAESARRLSDKKQMFERKAEARRQALFNTTELQEHFKAAEDVVGAMDRKGMFRDPIERRSKRELQEELGEQADADSGDESDMSHGTGSSSDGSGSSSSSSSVAESAAVEEKWANDPYYKGKVERATGTFMHG